MALVVADRVQETTTTTGTGTYTLAGAKDGFQSFGAVGNSNTTYYACTDGTDYEVGIGTYTASGTTLARTTIIESSNSDAAVNWGAGEKDIFVTLPASKALVQDASDDVTLADNEKLIFGTGSDLQIYHNGNNSYIQDTGTGKLHITSNGTGVSIDKGTSELMATFDIDGAVTLYYDSAAKLATTTTGINVTGNATFADNGKAIFGAGSDLQIFHDGTHTYIDEINPTGYLFIRGANTQLLNPSNEIYLECNNDGSVDLYHDNSKKLATTSTGISVTGSLAVTDAATTRTNIDVDQAGTALALAIALG